MELIIQKLKELSDTIKFDKSVSRLHDKSRFNKKFLLLRSSLKDFRVFYERINNESEEAQDIINFMMTRNLKKDNGNLTEKGGEPELRLHQLMNLLDVDLKAMYVFSKIFIMRHIELMVSIIDGHGIRTSGFSKFLTSIEEIKNKPNEYPLWSEFACNFLSKLRILECRIFFYRDKFIEHHKIYDNHDILSMFGIPYGNFELHSISSKVPKERSEKVRQIIQRTNALSFLKQEKDNRKIAKEIFDVLPNLPEGEDKEELKRFIISAGIASLNHQELFNITKDFIIDSSNFIIEVWPEIEKNNKTRISL